MANRLLVSDVSPSGVALTSSRYVLTAAVLMLLVGMGVRASFGLFMQPMGLQHGWGRDAFSLAFALQNISWGLGAIIFGALADKFGSGRMVLLAVVLYAFGMLGTAYANTLTALYFYAGLVVGLGQAGTTFAVILPVVARAVAPAQRSAAMGIASAGGSLGQFIVVPLTQLFISSWDWVTAFWLLSSLLLLTLPLSYALRARQAAPTIRAVDQLSLGQAVRQAMRHPSFYFLFASYAVCGFHTAFITLHLPAFASDQGLSANVGAFSVALIGLFNVFGSYAAGRLGGFISKRLLLMWIYALRSAVILLLLMFPVTPFIMYVFAAAMGFLWLGTVPLTNGLVAHIYGMRYAATLSGMVFLGHQIGSFIGVWFGGRVFTLTGSYNLVWWLALALALGAALLCVPIREQTLVSARAGVNPI